MFLEYFNAFLGLPLAWLGLALFAVTISILAARFWFASSPQKSTQHQSSGFICPCYAPPVNSPENKQ